MICYHGGDCPDKYITEETACPSMSTKDLQHCREDNGIKKDAEE